MGSITRMVIEAIGWFWGLPILGKLFVVGAFVFAIWLLNAKDKAKEKLERAKELG